MFVLLFFLYRSRQSHVLVKYNIYNHQRVEQHTSYQSQSKQDVRRGASGLPCLRDRGLWGRGEAAVPHVYQARHPGLLLLYSGGLLCVAMPPLWVWEAGRGGAVIRLCRRVYYYHVIIVVMIVMGWF